MPRLVFDVEKLMAEATPGVEYRFIADRGEHNYSSRTVMWKIYGRERMRLTSSRVGAVYAIYVKAGTRWVQVVTIVVSNSGFLVRFRYELVSQRCTNYWRVRRKMCALLGNPGIGHSLISGMRVDFGPVDVEGRAIKIITEDD